MKRGLRITILLVLFPNVRGEIFSSDEVPRLFIEINSNQNKNVDHHYLSSNDDAGKEAVVDNDSRAKNLISKNVIGESDNATNLNNATENHKESNTYFTNVNTEIINKPTNDDVNAGSGNKTVSITDLNGINDSETNSSDDFDVKTNNKTKEVDISSKEKLIKNKYTIKDYLDTEKNDGTIKNESIRNKHNGKEEIQEIFSFKRSRNPVNVIHASDNVAEEFGDSLNSAKYSTVDRYSCTCETANETHLILYGTKTWTFPLQDVNLTLSYPPEKSPKDSVKHVDYIITGFNVILYIDGVESRGFITKGGVLQERISLSFISSGITSLLYKFWLYGNPKNRTNAAELDSLYFPCS